jgi:sec-independent protein translocase protein TatC
LQAKTLLKYWRHVIVLSFIISAILTPTPDPVNQTIMAAPIISLYLISVATLALTRKLF